MTVKLILTILGVWFLLALAMTLFFGGVSRMLEDDLPQEEETNDYE